MYFRRMQQGASENNGQCRIVAFVCGDQTAGENENDGLLASRASIELCITGNLSLRYF